MESIKKEDIINLSYKDITNIILEKSKKGLNTLDLFTKIVELLELPKSTIDTKIADFYTSLTTDKRFLLVDGLWDLRSRHTSDKVLVMPEDDEEDEENFDEIEEIDEEEDVPYESDIDDDTSYDDDDDDELSDLVVLDEDDMDIENN